MQVHIRKRGNNFMEKIIVNPGMVNFIYQAHMGFHKGKLSFEVYDGNLKEMSLRLKICKNMTGGII